MTRRSHWFWTRPSMLGVLLLPMLVVVGAGSSSSALETSPASLSATAQPLAGAPARPPGPALRAARAAVTAPATDPMLFERRYLHDIPFGATIAAVGARYDVDPLLIASVAEAESSFRVDAVSPKGALGLMQVMPFHIDENVEPFDPEVNLELGASLLADLSARFDGRLDLALAAYHAGPGAVERYHGVPPYASTQRYVERVLEIYLEHYAELAGESRG